MTRPTLRLAWGAPLLLTLSALLVPLGSGLSRAHESDPSPGNSSTPADADRGYDLPGRFLTYESTHFTVRSDAPADWTRGRVGLLERTSHQVQRFSNQLGVRFAPPKEKLSCLLFDGYDDYADFARREDEMSMPWVAGYYASRANHVVYYNDADAPNVRQADEQLAAAREQLSLLKRRELEASRERQKQAVELYAAQRAQLEAQLRQEEARLRALVDAASDAKAIHEATHLLAFNTGLQSRYHQYPFWFTEGLATCFETDAPSAAFGPDFDYQPRRARFDELLAGGSLLPLREFVGRTEVPDGSAETADVMYHQAYSLLMYLHRYKKRELKHFLDAVAAEPPGRIGAARQTALFEASFGSVEALERRWLAHERQR